MLDLERPREEENEFQVSWGYILILSLDTIPTTLKTLFEPITYLPVYSTYNIAMIPFQQFLRDDLKSTVHTKEDKTQVFPERDLVR